MKSVHKYSHLGNIVVATQVITSRPDPGQARNIIFLLAGSVALMMTGFGIIMPVFARRLDEFGSGVQALGLMTMAFALAQFIASPFMGSLADRFGRRPIILLSLASFMLANIGYLLAPSTAVFIIIRAFAGGFTAGLFPAAMGVVGDIVAPSQRARWIGIVMGGYGAGLVFGPVIGGLLYDRWGFAAPFIASAIAAFIALLSAAILVPETRTPKIRYREKLRQRRTVTPNAQQKSSLWASLPRPLYILGMLLFIDFIGTFAFTFVEPQMVFYVYDDLSWTTTQFGLAIGGYGLAMMLGQTLLGRISDKQGRKPVIIAGILLNTSLYVGLAFLTGFWQMIVVSIVAGFGAALIAPAVSAFYLDITAEQHRSRVLGIKESALALGGVAGPLLVAIVGPVTTPQTVFLIASMLMLIAGILTLLILKEPDQIPKESGDISRELIGQRSMAAQASLRGIVLGATTRRRQLQPTYPDPLSLTHAVE